MAESVQIITLIVSIFGLLAWIARLIIPYLLKKLDEKDAHINTITKEFRETINHKQTEFTRSLNHLSTSMEKYAEATKGQTEIFKQLIHDKSRN